MSVLSVLLGGLDQRSGLYQMAKVKRPIIAGVALFTLEFVIM